MKRILIIVALVLALLPLIAVYHKIGDFPSPGIGDVHNLIIVEGDLAYVAHYGITIMRRGGVADF